MPRGRHEVTKRAGVGLCPNCGVKRQPGMRFCAGCGLDLSLRALDAPGRGRSIIVAPWIAAEDPDAGLSEMEHFWSIALDNLGMLSSLRRIASGTPDNVEVEVRAVLRVPLIAGSLRFVIAHNHPNQQLYPSAEDMALTRRIMEAAGICGLVLADHVIIGRNGMEWSLLQHGLIEPEHPSPPNPVAT
jgi:DNA repair protein RadC